MEENQVPIQSSLPSRAIVEVSENMRAKIYGIFCKLGIRNRKIISLKS